MELTNLLTENELLKLKITDLENELMETKEHLKKYTAPKRSKKYYEEHKEEIIKKVKEYHQINPPKPISPEKRKEYNKLAYLKKKEKLQNKENI